MINLFLFLILLDVYDLFIDCLLVVLLSSRGQRKWSESGSTSRVRLKTFRLMMFMKVGVLFVPLLTEAKFNGLSKRYLVSERETNISSTAFLFQSDNPIVISLQLVSFY